MQHLIRVYKVQRPPSLFDKCTVFFYMRYTTHGTTVFTSHPKEEAMVSRNGLLAKIPGNVHCL